MSEAEGPENVSVVQNETSSSRMPRVLQRLNELPIVISVCEYTSDMYTRIREKNYGTQLGFGAAEGAVKAVVVTSHMTYSILPKCGLAGKLKDGFEQKVSQVDIMACNGLEFLQNKWLVAKGQTNKVIALGAEKLEQSDLAEVLITVTEAAVDYFKPPEENAKNQEKAGLPVVQTKVDRIRAVSYTIGDEGTKVLSFAASAGFGCARAAAQWTWNITQHLLQKIPVVNGMFTAFLDPTQGGDFLFLPPNHGEGGRREIVGRKQKLRRSKRLTVKGDYHRIIDASEPFSVSPDRKRKYDKEEGEEALIEELIHVSESYKSDEDADYVPDDDEDEESESSEDEDDDDDEDEDDGADEEEKQDENGTKTLVKPTTTVQAESKTEARGTVHATFQGKTDSQIKTSVKQKPTTRGTSPGKTVPKQELSVKPEAKVQAISQEKAESKETDKVDQKRVEEKKDAGRYAKPNASNADTDPKKTFVKPTTTVQAESKNEARGTVHATFQGKTDSQIKTSVKQKATTQGTSPGKTAPKQELSVKPEAKVQAILQEKAESKETGKVDQKRVEEKKDAGRYAKPNASNADTDPKKNEAPIEDAKNKKTVEGGLLGVIKAFNNKM